MGFLANILLYAKLLDCKPMYTAFGFLDSQPTFIGLIIVTMYISIPFNTVSSLFLMLGSYKCIKSLELYV